MSDLVLRLGDALDAFRGDSRTIPREVARAVGRAVITVTVTLLSGMVTAWLPTPTQAWTGSPNVVLFGSASCATVPNAADVIPRSAWTRVSSTGETVEQPMSFWSYYWESRLHTIPPQGSWVDIWIYCSVPGVGSEWRFARSTFVTRPWIGQAINMGSVRA